MSVCSAYHLNKLKMNTMKLKSEDEDAVDGDGNDDERKEII